MPVCAGVVSTPEVMHAGNRAALLRMRIRPAPLGSARRASTRMDDIVGNMRTVGQVDTDRTYSVAEAASILRCSPATLRDRVTRREVPHHRSGRLKGVYFTEGDLEQILQTQTRQVTPMAASRTAAKPSLNEVPPEFAVLRRGVRS